MTFPFPYKPLREQIAYKQHEAHTMKSRDALCAHYRLNKSDLIKYLIKKSINLKDAHWFAWVAPMKKSVLLNPVEYQMLIEVAKRNHQKPEAFLASIIEKVYAHTK